MAATRAVTSAAWALAVLFVTTGVLHFTSPRSFEGIVPPFLGAPAFWVAASGVAELACAGLLALPRTRRLGGWASVVLLIAVYPANITMAVQSLHGEGSVLISFLRLPLQIPLVLWALWIARAGAVSSRRAGRVPSIRAGARRSH